MSRMGTAQKEHTKKWPAILLIMIFMLPMGGVAYLFLPLPETFPRGCHHIEGEIMEKNINEGWCVDGVCIMNHEFEVADNRTSNNTTTVIVPPIHYFRTEVGDIYDGPLC